MPIADGTIATHGATVELLIGVNLHKKDALQRVGFPAPERIRVVAQIDTGTSFSAIDHRVLSRLGITPIDKKEVRTPTTEVQKPLVFDQYVVSPENASTRGANATPLAMS